MLVYTGHYVLKEKAMILFRVNFQHNSDHSKLWSVQSGLSECDTKLLKLLTFWVVGNDSESGMSHVTVTSYCCKKSFCLSRRHSWCVKMETGNFSPKLVIKKKKPNFLQFFPIPDCTLPGKPKSNSQYNVCISQTRSRRRRQNSFFQRLSPGNTTLESLGDSFSLKIKDLTDRRSQRKREWHFQSNQIKCLYCHGTAAVTTKCQCNSVRDCWRVYRCNIKVCYPVN